MSSYDKNKVGGKLDLKFRENQKVGNSCVEIENKTN